MPHLCEITLSGPESDVDDATQVMEAMAAAVEAGWESPRVVSDEEDLGPEVLEGEPDGGSILDYRVFGYPGGAIILVVLDGADLEQAALAAAALARHLTTWAPALLEFTIDKVSVSFLDRPVEEDDWLPDLGDQEPAPRWPPAEHLDDELRSLAAQYLLAGAVRSLWDPAATGDRTVDAHDVVAGSGEHPWGRELAGALGILLIRAARLEAETGVSTRLVVRGSGDPELAEDLLRRARATGPHDTTEVWTDDEMRGHVLVSTFMDDHSLTWNQVPDDEPPDRTEARSARQLRELLWAGLRTLATLASPLARIQGPWQLLDQLGEDHLVSVLAGRETDELDATAENDSDEIQSAATAQAAMWLAIRRPELIDTAGGERLIELIAEDAAAFHHVAYNTLLMAGTGPTRKAVSAQPLLPNVRTCMLDFVGAQALTGPDAEIPGNGERGDAYDDMHQALEDALAEDENFGTRLRNVLAVAGRSARLTQTDVNPHRDAEGYISTPRAMAAELLARAAEHATAILSERDGDATVRLTALALVAQVSATAAGEMATDFPDLTGDDPRTEPAARERAHRWLEEALRTADGADGQDRSSAHAESSPDARAVLAAMTAGQDMPPEWTIHRLVAAAAEAATITLQAAGALDATQEIFTRR